MGRQVRIDDALRPAVLMLREAYECRKITADEVNAMVCYLLHGTADDDAAAEDEGVSEGVSLTVSLPVSLKEENERKERSKENKEKEERLSLSARKALKISFVIPSAEEVQQYLDEVGETRFTGEDFCNYYEANGWMASEGCPVKSWKAMARTWRKRERKAIKGKDNVTNKNQQRQAAGAGAQAGQAGDAEEHRQEDMERHLESHHPGDDRLARLAREINQVAQEMGVPTSEYSLRQIAFDAQSLLYRMAFCEGWTDEKWQAAMAHVKAHVKGKKLNTDVLIGEVFEWSRKRP